MIIVVVGPTAVGKTKMSVSLAKMFNGEIINADSCQIYKGMDVGTAKVTKDEMEGIPHHLLDICNVNDLYTVYDYQKDAREKIEEIKSRGKTPIMVGGTGLYIKAALYNYDFKDNKNLEYIDELSNDELIKEIKEIDNSIDIDFNNRRRLISTLKSLKNKEKQVLDKDTLLYNDVIFIGLTTDRSLLYERIDERFKEMIPNLLLEVKNFYDQNIDSKAIKTAIGYKELYEYFKGNISLEEAILLCQKNSRHYAKRQYTWFNNQMDINWFNVDFNNFAKTIEEVTKFIQERV